MEGTVSDVVVTVPKHRWREWIAEGDLPGEPWSGKASYFGVTGWPDIKSGERVYIVAHGKLRGYAPLVSVLRTPEPTYEPTYLVRHFGAVAVTIDEPIRGFRGWRYRWWKREDERPFLDWREP